MYRLAFAAPAAIIVALVAVVASLAIGAQEIPPADVWAAFVDYDPANASHQIVRDLRVDRTVIGIAAGAALAVAGALTQSLTRNPLADPGLLGLNAGAALAIVLGTVVAGVGSFAPQILLAFMGAAVAGLVAYGVGATGAGAAAPARLVLAGAAVTALLTAVTSAIVVAQPFALNQLRFWLAGSLTGRAGVPTGPLVVGIGLTILVALLAVRPLSAIALGDDAAASLGTRAGLTRVHVLVTVIALAGVATALAGPIAFVGLAVPHLVRALVGPRIGWLLVLSIPFGAAVVLLCDVAGRIVARPGEISVGVTTALLGGILLALLARRMRAVAP
ncbi:iron ABC transporter permease [Demequina sp. TTPB684]|uniref:FecCD family ABC transporter permease n=1 Tax=unclassified Demequina TaxID=2620311 RepID=UPI001CF3B6B3|nr:iron ABC transporter permease [Demequina sp. TMPB413]MCB2412239.1 iron ABC transporter permease [Demequina sp. TTPB684]UPU87779.1 iron ABC transporter permease [Demequina sp. TMPB413]